MDQESSGHDYTKGQDYNVLEHFTRRGLLPDASQYVTVDDLIVVNAWAPITATTIQISIRLLLPNGQIAVQNSALAVAPNGTTASVAKIQGCEGFLLSLTISATSASRGACFAMAFLQRGQGSSDATLGKCLCSGYPSQFAIVAYPDGGIQDSQAGPGQARIVQVTTPGAGAELSLVVPAGVVWFIKALGATLTTAVGGSARQPNLIIDDGTNGHTVSDTQPGSTLAAGSSQFFGWFPNGVNPNAFGNPWTSEFPEFCRLTGGMRIRTATLNIAAGDQWSAIWALVEQWIGV